MPETFEALAVVILALLPGALYTWGYERHVGSWGITRSDRVTRFIGGSVVFQVLAAPLTYYLYSKYWTTSLIRNGKPLPWWLWGVLAGYVLIPFFVGDRMGRSANRGGRLNKLFAGPNPAPRAWDHLFSSNPEGWVRVKLISGNWLGGLILSNATAQVPDTSSLTERLRRRSKRLWALAWSSAARRAARNARADSANRAKLARAYAAAYPETQDIYLPYTVAVDPVTGMLLLDSDGKPQTQTAGVLLRWETIEYLEVRPFQPWP
jgi:Family of unknown function (DUF6338)